MIALWLILVALWTVIVWFGGISAGVAIGRLRAQEDALADYQRALREWRDREDDHRL